MPGRYVGLAKQVSPCRWKGWRRHRDPESDEDRLGAAQAKGRFVATTFSLQELEFELQRFGRFERSVSTRELRLTCPQLLTGERNLSLRERELCFRAMKGSYPEEIFGSQGLLQGPFEPAIGCIPISRSQLDLAQGLTDLG